MSEKESESKPSVPYRQQGMAVLPEVKHIIAVASGKGGVGKSTIAVNLALSLAKAGATVGIVDADIYGPSVPVLLGAKGERAVVKEKRLQPIIRHGLQSMSMGYLVDQHVPMSWRGPMLGKALEQLVNDTAWQGLDYLIVDLPPGTGDVQLTLCQKIPVTGAVIVTTPQDLALVDVRRACEMFKTLNIPMLGVIENMSTYHCQQCGHEESIFGEGGAAQLAQAYHLELLGVLPLALSIRELTDNGQGFVLQAADSEAAHSFAAIARKISAAMSAMPKNYAAKFPKIVVEGPSQSVKS